MLIYLQDELKEGVEVKSFNFIAIQRFFLDVILNSCFIGSNLEG